MIDNTEEIIPEESILVSLKDVSLEYQAEKEKVLALSHVDLDIKKGEFICVLGTSGCGKSTLLNILAGFHKHTSGVAEMDGKPIEGPNWKRGVVFQAPPLYPWLNIYDNIAFGPTKRKLSKEYIETQVNKYIDLVGLNDFKNKKPYELSGGMRQRASLARVLVNKPEMILMDEPLGALDALTRTHMQSLIRRIWNKTQSTIFFITHDVDEALALATRIIVMSARPGRIVKEFDVDFTYDMDGVNHEAARYSEEYMEIREEIYNIINSQR